MSEAASRLASFIALGAQPELGNGDRKRCRQQFDRSYWPFR
jgi:hypothetical protein